MITEKVVVVLLVCIVFASAANSQPLSKYDKWLVPSYFRGFNTSIWNNVYGREMTVSDLMDMRSSGANLAIIQTKGLLEPLPPYNPVDSWYTDGLDSMVSYCRQAGLYYVICPRSGPGRQDVWEEGEGLVPRSTIWMNTTEQQLYAQMLKDIVEIYTPDTLFIGLDMIQEPNPFDADAACLPVAELDAMMADSGIDVNALYTMCVESVRTVDTEIPLLVQGVHWSNPGYFSLVQLQTDDKIVYNTHCYNPHDYSHAYPEYSVTYPAYIWGCAYDWYAYWCGEFIRDTVLAPVRTFQTTHNVPILLGEFGMMVAQNGGEQYLSDIAGAACEFGWHFAFWSFRTDSGFNYELMGASYWSTVCSLLTCTAAVTQNERIILPNIPHISAHPNPFNSSCVITVPAGAKIEICDLRGNVVINGWLQSTANCIRKFIWTPDGSIPSGVYLVKAKTRDGGTISRRIAYLK